MLDWHEVLLPSAFASSFSLCPHLELDRCDVLLLALPLRLGPIIILVVLLVLRNLALRLIVQVNLNHDGLVLVLLKWA